MQLDVAAASLSFESMKLIRDSRDPTVSKTNNLYRPLSFEKAEIRLLTFTSPQTEGPLQCSLMSVPLPKSPPYIALSYTWGDPADTVPIIINNFEVQITVNLSTALRRLREEGVTHIWADALCINQGDREERTAQVGRMGTIFRKATEVAVWLGQGNLERVMEQALQNLEVGISEPWNFSKENQDAMNLLVKELLSQPYWKRVWIIQEVAVASRIFVYCGNHKVGWDQFLNMCQFDAENAVPNIYNALEAEVISGFTTLLELRRDTLARKPIRFLDALHQSRASLSTDPRDKLYALLGLSYDGRHFIPEPNYMNSVVETFTDFATALIEGGELLDFIYLRSPNRRNDGRLPSWVPDCKCLERIISLVDTISRVSLRTVS
jgi:Heterokaryon incompatibility protein (HET)